jgi:hypothetical protein
MSYDFTNLADLELVVLCAKGDAAHRELARRRNLEIDIRQAQLAAEIEDQRSALQYILKHKDGQHNIVKKNLDKVIEAMENRMHLLCAENNNLCFSRVSEEYPPMGPAMA